MENHSDSLSYLQSLKSDLERAFEQENITYKSNIGLLKQKKDYI